MKQFEPDPAALNAARQINKQATVSAYPVLDRQVNLKYFGVDLPRNGMIPVYIRIHSDAGMERYILDLEKCSLSGQLPSSSGITSSVADMDKGTEGFMDTTAILLFTPAILGGMAAVTDIAETKERIEKGALRKTVIRPGDVIEGFVYFQARVEALQKYGGMIHLEMLELGSRKRESFDFPIRQQEAR